MPQVVCEWKKYDSFISNSDITISGRVRLFNVWMAPAKTSLATFTEFKHVDDSGFVVLKINNPAVRWPEENPNTQILKGGLLFPDGLFIKTPNDASNKYVGAITLIYQRS
tara:strand:+ start:270 stop:599 length:330 start_codon:yes stop_codon:yes gene_type:complete